MAERGIEITFDTEDFFIATLTRPETIQKEVTDQIKKFAERYEQNGITGKLR